MRRDPNPTVRPSLVHKGLVCDATGGPILRERLEAVPEAIYTLEAQRRWEGTP